MKKTTYLAVIAAASVMSGCLPTKHNSWTVQKYAKEIGEKTGIPVISSAEKNNVCMQKQLFAILNEIAPLSDSAREHLLKEFKPKVRMIVLKDPVVGSNVQLDAQFNWSGQEIADTYSPYDPRHDFSKLPLTKVSFENGVLTILPQIVDITGNLHTVQGVYNNDYHTYECGQKTDLASLIGIVARANESTASNNGQKMDTQSAGQRADVLLDSGSSLDLSGR